MQRRRIFLLDMRCIYFSVYLYTWSLPLYEHQPLSFLLFAFHVSETALLVVYKYVQYPLSSRKRMRLFLFRPRLVLFIAENRAIATGWNIKRCNATNASGMAERTATPGEHYICKMSVADFAYETMYSHAARETEVGDFNQRTTMKRLFVGLNCNFCDCPSTIRLNLDYHLNDVTRLHLMRDFAPSISITMLCYKQIKYISQTYLHGSENSYLLVGEVCGFLKSN